MTHMAGWGLNWFAAQTLMETARDKSKGKPIANNTRLYEKNPIADEGGGLGSSGYEIRLHGNLIIEIHPCYVKLYDGGWKTVTTKARLNQFGMWAVYQKDFDWYVIVDGKHEDFVNGMVLPYE